jgi:polyhydroxyalkanoate synthesis regulator phasin
MEEEVQQVLNLVDKLGSPDEMSKEEYKDFLEELVSVMQIRIDATQAELDGEDEDHDDDDGEGEDDDE